MKKVFIDGSSGTTGLELQKRLALRKDISLITVPYAERHDEKIRAQAAAASDLTFLCLPDEEAEHIADLIDEDTIIIDTSTAHRTKEGWTYGLAELCGQREKIADAKRIANPGCHATGVIALIAPLIRAGILRKDAYLSCVSLTGYSGGGKKMITQYEENPSALFAAPRLYGLKGSHKHMPEIMKMTGLAVKPAFMPVVANFYRGMETIISLSAQQSAGHVEDIKKLYEEVYPGPVIYYNEAADEDGFVSSAKLSGKDSLEVSVYENDAGIILISRFDNLGKGACGAAIQNMNIVFGFNECEGLAVEE